MMIRSNCARRAALSSLTAAALGLLLQSAPAHAESGWSLLNMTQGVTDISRKIYDLHMIIFWVCVVIAVFVFGAMLWSIVKFRKSQGAVADTEALRIGAFGIAAPRLELTGSERAVRPVMKQKARP